MPEIAEVARVVHFLRLHLVGKKVKHAIAPDDPVVFGKAGTTGPAIVAALAGKKVLSAGSQGKYFWLVMESPPHPVMHLGMTGWVHINGEQTGYTGYYNKLKPGEELLWPPKYWKFQLETEGDPKVQVAFTDPRRFGRVRLVDCPGEAIRKRSPLVENGPDPVVDTDVFTEAYLRNRMRSRHVPIKALLLDQAAISGIGNWVGDEVLYQARLHPEQYCDDFSDEQIADLYHAVRYVCQTAVDLLGDSDTFPEEWLFNHRWGKGTKSEVAKLPNGEKLAFLTVGGRTSCYAPGVQKKSGRVAPGVKEEPLIATGGEADDDKEGKPKAKKLQAEKSRAKAPEIKEEGEEEDDKPQNRKRKGQADNVAQLKKAGRHEAGPKRMKATPKPDPPEPAGGRRSGRLSRK